MTKKADATQSPSRRNFTKSVAAALVVTPIAASLSSCDSSPTGPPPGDSIPPIIITDGSFLIETDEELESDGSGSMGPNGNPRKKYRRKNGSDKHIRCVTIKKKGKIVFCKTFDEKDCSIEIYWDTNCKEGDTNCGAA